ncbi:MAG: S-layer homology domain-containing protein [Candidatus Peribacteraceae bacterium]|nr:S-layer homology domain-containing protein [Candidatus Peribacteraceae bacterium]
MESRIIHSKNVLLIAGAVVGFTVLSLLSLPMGAGAAGESGIVRVYAGSGGTVSPAGGIVTLPDGASRRFTVTPESGWTIAFVVIDGNVTVKSGILTTDQRYDLSLPEGSDEHTLTAYFTDPAHPVVLVASREALKAAVASAVPGTTVLVAPGTYAPTNIWNDQTGLYLHDIHGTSGAWITIRGLDPAHPPVIADTNLDGITVDNCSYLNIGNFRIERAGRKNASGVHTTGDKNGYALSGSHHLFLHDLIIVDSGIDAAGKNNASNSDGIKLSNTDYFTIRNVTIDNWGTGGGSAVDITTSRFGVVEDSRFRWTSGGPVGSTAGVTVKGGSTDVRVLRNFFLDAGLEAIQVGQDMGLQFFRIPPGDTMPDGTPLDFEARDIDVAGNIIVGTGLTRAAVMWMKSLRGNVHHNTIVMTGADAGDRSILKITSAEGDNLPPARDGTFAHNLVVYEYDSLMTYRASFTAYKTENPFAATFSFDHNAWYQLDAAAEGDHVPDTVGLKGLPVREADPVYRIDPDLRGISEGSHGHFGLTPEQLRIRSQYPALRGIGADAFTAQAASGTPSFGTGVDQSVPAATSRSSGSSPRSSSSSSPSPLPPTQSLSGASDEGASSVRTPSASVRLTVVRSARVSSMASLPSDHGSLLMIEDGRSTVYRDVPVSAWFAAAIHELLQRHIVSGYADASGRLLGLFGPGDNVTYAEVAKMALEAADTPLAVAKIPINRSARQHWASAYIATAESLLPSLYYPALEVDAPASRAAVIRIFMEAFDLAPQTAPDPYLDLPVSHPHREAVLTATKLGIIRGDTAADGKPLGTVRPDEPVNRAEAATIVSRFLPYVTPR